MCPDLRPDLWLDLLLVAVCIAFTHFYIKEESALTLSNFFECIKMSPPN